MKTGYVVHDIMTNKPVTVTSESTIMNAAKLMMEKGVGSLLVMEKEELKGILTEKDIVTKIVMNNKDASKTKVKDAMTQRNDIITIEPNKDMYDAIILMKDNDIRRLPVLEKGKLKGLITLKDILKIEPDLFDVMVEKIKLREESRKLGSNNYEED